MEQSVLAEVEMILAISIPVRYDWNARVERPGRLAFKISIPVRYDWNTTKICKICKTNIISIPVRYDWNPYPTLQM